MNNKTSQQSESIDISWHKDQQKLWSKQIEQDQAPHALLLLGSNGIGKRSLAAWMIAKFLNISSDIATPVYPHQVPMHADVQWITPEDGKISISVDQIRVLINELSKTSYLGNGKVALIEPANAMTLNAANSLLKTLEEPSGNTLIILVADRMKNIPATIRSRCQQFNIAKPSISNAVHWLKDADDSIHWNEVPEYIVSHPLLALEKKDEIKKILIFKQQLIELLIASASPIQVAASWSKEEPHFVLDWLCHFVTSVIYQVFDQDASRGNELELPLLNKLNKLNLFFFLDAIYKLRNQSQGSYNLQMAYESLLIDWSMGIESCNQNQIIFDYLPANFFQTTNNQS